MNNVILLLGLGFLLFTTSASILPPSTTNHNHPTTAFIVGIERTRTTTTTKRIKQQQQQQQQQQCVSPMLFQSSSSNNNENGEDEDEDKESEGGATLAAEFFKTLQQRNIPPTSSSNTDNELDEEEDDDDEEDEDEEEINFPQGAINAMTGFDVGGVGDLAGNVSLTNKEVYDALKERVLESAGSFVELVGGSDDDNDDDDNDDDDDELLSSSATKKSYKAPSTTNPDSGLTAGEVVTTILMGLLHNDIPTPNYGIELLFGYSSSGSAIRSSDVELTPMEYAEFLKETDDYGILFHHSGEIVIEKGDYSFDQKKAFFTARLKVLDGNSGSGSGGNGDYIFVNFILSTTGRGEDDCWLIDSMLIRPQKMRRRRRR